LALAIILPSNALPDMREEKGARGDRQMKSKVARILFFLLGILLTGCTIHHQARLYDLETGNVIMVNSRIRGNRAINEPSYQQENTVMGSL